MRSRPITVSLTALTLLLAAGLPVTARAEKADRDKPVGLRAARGFKALGFRIVATSGTASHLRDHGVEVDRVVAKIQQASGVAADESAAEAVDGVDLIAGGEIDLVASIARTQLIAAVGNVCVAIPGALLLDDELLGVVGNEVAIGPVAVEHCGELGEHVGVPGGRCTDVPLDPGDLG